MLAHLSGLRIAGAVRRCQAVRVATARERVVSFLHSELERVATCDDDDYPGEEARPEREGRVAGVLGALVAVELLGADNAEVWRLRLSGLATGRPTPSDSTRRAADELLRELLEAVPVDVGGTGEDAMRFAGALAALRAVGAASGDWYERRARRMGWPTACETGQEISGGTQRDLRAVLAGPAEAVDGVWVLCVLRFEDGVSLLLRLENGADRFGDRPWDFELFDDVGTTYTRAGAGGGADELRITYRTPAPADATWLELRREGSRPIRIPL
jgi:hypothetical protein